MSNKPEDRAFPSDIKNQNGLTKRDFFAAMAMQGVLFGGEYIEPVLVANQAVKYADALLEELAKGGGDVQ